MGPRRAERARIPRSRAANGRDVRRPSRRWCRGPGGQPRPTARSEPAAATPAPEQPRKATLRRGGTFTRPALTTKPRARSRGRQARRSSARSTNSASRRRRAVPGRCRLRCSCRAIRRATERHRTRRQVRRIRRRGKRRAQSAGSRRLTVRRHPTEAVDNGDRGRRSAGQRRGRCSVPHPHHARRTSLRASGTQVRWGKACGSRLSLRVGATRGATPALRPIPGY